jgi:hypothetical protein
MVVCDLFPQNGHFPEVCLPWLGPSPIVFHDDIEKLAKILSQGKEIVSENAREAARAELGLLRIRRVRWLFDTYYASVARPDSLIELNRNLTLLERYAHRASSGRTSPARDGPTMIGACEPWGPKPT